MNEATLALKLSGEEVRKALVDMIDQALAKDCFLNPNTAYDFMTGKITVEVSLHDSGIEIPLTVTKETMQGEEPDVADGVKIEIPVDRLPPNQTRVETGQPVPALTKDSDGRTVVKPIKYARRGPKKNG